MDKILTISIAAYNVESLIENTLNSIANCKSLEDLEVLVVDDGGTDGTMEKVQAYVSRYPNSIIPVHKENGGYGSVLNTSIQLATGRYFKQLDGDDWFSTEHLDAYIQRLKNTQADLVLTQVIEYYEDQDKTIVRDLASELAEGEYTFENAALKGIISMHSATIKTERLKQMRAPITEHCFYTDVELVNLPLPVMNTFFVWHYPIYVYRLGREGQSMSVTGIRKHYKDHEKVFWKLAALYRQMPDEEPGKKKLLMNRLRKEVAAHFKYCCMLTPSKESAQELKRFGGRLKKDAPEILAAARAYSRFVRLMADTGYLMYPVVSRHYEKKYANS